MNCADRRRLARHIGRLSPAQREQVDREARARLPLHVTDQLQAATRNARAGLARVAATTPQRHTVTMTPTPALQSRFDLLFATYLTGDLRQCAHIGTSPRVVCLSLWQDDYLYCGADGCKPDPLDPIEDRTCDLCRHTVPAIYPNVLQSENMIVAFGACPPCHSELLESAA